MESGSSGAQLKEFEESYALEQGACEGSDSEALIGPSGPPLCATALSQSLLRELPRRKAGPTATLGTAEKIGGRVAQDWSRDEKLWVDVWGKALQVVVRLDGSRTLGGVSDWSS